MNKVTWQYALEQAFKTAYIDYLPGVYNGRPSYSNLVFLGFDSELFNLSSSNAGPLVRHKKLLPDALGFTLPFLQFEGFPIKPKFIDDAFLQYLSATKPKHSSSKLEDFHSMQAFAKLMFDSLSMIQMYDRLLIIVSMILSRRYPLPACKPDLRQKEWIDLTLKKKDKDRNESYVSYGNPSDFCVGFIVTGMAHKYLNLTLPQAGSGLDLWEARWGIPYLV